jgi:phosphatidate phosphatase PAH1
MNQETKDTIREELQTRINHTAKLVPQSQRELFLSEIDTIVKEAYQQGAKDKVEEVVENIKKIDIPRDIYYKKIVDNIIESLKDNT